MMYEVFSLTLLSLSLSVQVNKGEKAKSRFKKVENCNYAVDVAKEMGLSVVRESLSVAVSVLCLSLCSVSVSSLLVLWCVV